MRTYLRSVSIVLALLCLAPLGATAQTLKFKPPSSVEAGPWLTPADGTSAGKAEAVVPKPIEPKVTTEFVPLQAKPRPSAEPAIEKPRPVLKPSGAEPSEQDEALTSAEQTEKTPAPFIEDVVKQGAKKSKPSTNLTARGKTPGPSTVPSRSTINSEYAPQPTYPTRPQYGPPGVRPNSYAYGPMPGRRPDASAVRAPVSHVDRGVRPTAFDPTVEDRPRTLPTDDTADVDNAPPMPPQSPAKKKAAQPHPMQPSVEEAYVDAPGAMGGPEYGPYGMNSDPWYDGYDDFAMFGPGFGGGPMGPQLFWLRTDFAFAFAKGDPVPALVTTAPAGTPSTALPPPGALGRPDTTILFGDRRIDNNFRPGGRIRGGFYFDPCQLVGFNFDYFALGNVGSHFSATGVNGAPILMRPFFDVAPGQNRERVEIVSFPNTLDGTVSVDTVSRFQTVSPLLRFNFGCRDRCDTGCGYGCDSCGTNGCDPCRPARPYVNWAFTGGYRWARLDDSVDITENLVATDGSGNNFIVRDGFSSRNYFNGADFGILSEAYFGRWVLETQGRIALGNNHKVVHIKGQTITNGTPLVGGLLAQQTNIGDYSRDDFASMPELDFNLGYQCTPHMRAYVGYTFLYFAQVARAGDQIDTHVDSRGVPRLNGTTTTGLTRPAFNGFSLNDYWVQAVTLGLDCRW